MKAYYRLIENEHVKRCVIGFFVKCVRILTVCSISVEGNCGPNPVESLSREVGYHITVASSIAWWQIIKATTSLQIANSWSEVVHHCCIMYILKHRLFGRRSKKTSKAPRHWPLTGEFTAQMASNAENVFTWWRHHAKWAGQSLEFMLSWYNFIQYNKYYSWIIVNLAVYFAI